MAADSAGTSSSISLLSTASGGGGDARRRAKIVAIRDRTELRTERRLGAIRPQDLLAQSRFQMGWVSADAEPSSESGLAAMTRELAPQ